MIRLTKREKLMGLVLVGFAAILSVYVLAVRPAVDRLNTLDRLIPRKQQELQDLSVKTREYIFLRDSSESLHAAVASQQESFRLLPFLESLIRQSGLEKSLASMKQHVLPLEPDYSETIVEIRFESLTLAQLVDFLSKVESSDVLARTKSLYIRKNPANKDLLDSVIEIHSAKLAPMQAARM
jgi:type II secretory pathway component PulM